MGRPTKFKKGVMSDAERQRRRRDRLARERKVEAAEEKRQRRLE